MANTLKHGSYEKKREIKESQEKQVKQQHSHHNQAGILNTLLGKVSEDYLPSISQRRKKKKKHEHSQGLGL